MNRVIRISTIVIALLIGQQALALVNLHGLIGRSWSEYKGEDGAEDSGARFNNVTLGAYFDPIPLVPIAFGPVLTIESYDDSQPGEGPDTLSNTQLGLDVMVWLPMLDIVYAKLGYNFYSNYMSEYSEGSNTVKGKGSLTGYHFAVGLKFGIIPLLDLLVEADFATETFKVDSLEYNGQDILDEDDESDVQTNSLLVGVSFGL